MEKDAPKSAKRIAVAWFRRAEYPVHRALDPENLQDTFDEWERNARKVRRQLKRGGVHTTPVLLSPEELIAWCRERLCAIGPRARAELAAERLAEQSRQEAAMRADDWSDAGDEGE